MGKCAFRLLRLLTFLLAIGGVFLSAYLLSMYAGGANTGLAKHVCGGEFDCLHVQQSRWGSIPLGPLRIPQAVVGIGYFTIIAVWIAMVGRLPGRLHYTCLLPTLMATAGVANGIYLIHVMANELGVWCSLCLATHGVNLLMAVGLWVLWIGGCRAQPEVSEGELARGHMWKVPTLAFVNGVLLSLTALLAVAALALLNLYQHTRGQLERIEGDEAYQQWRFAQAEPVRLPLAAEAPVRGDAAAPHTVVVFADFQCTYCATADLALREVQQALDGQFRVAFRHFPKNLSCNQALTKAVGEHAFACSAAAAAEAARRIGGDEAFWKMHDALFENQSRLDLRPYVELARSIDLDPVAFEQALHDPAVHERILEDTRLAREAGVESTPSVFLDGRPVEAGIVYDAQDGKKVDLAATTARWRSLLEWADHAASTQPHDQALSAVR